MGEADFYNLCGLDSASEYGQQTYQLMRVSMGIDNAKTIWLTDTCIRKKQSLA